MSDPRDPKPPARRFPDLVGVLRGLDAETRTAGFLLSIALLYALRAAWFFHGVDAAVHFDEGYIAAFGERLLDGRFLPYVDAVSQRGPVLYWLTAIVQGLFGRFQWTGIRHLVFICFMVSTVGVFLVGWAARRTLTGAIASLSFVVIMVVILEEETVFGLLGEPVATPFVLCSAAAVGYALERACSRRSRLGWLAIGGSLAALAGLTKQTYLPAIVPFVLWTVLVGATSFRGERTRRAFVLSGVLLGGWLVPIALVILVYAFAGELHDFWYWFYRFNREVYMAPFDAADAVRALDRWGRKNAFLVFALVMLVVHSLTRVFADAQASEGRGLSKLLQGAFALMVVAQLLIAVAGALAPLRFWSQYYLPPVPWVALLLGWTLQRAATDGKARSSWGFVTVAVLLGAISVGSLEAKLQSWHRRAANGRWASAYPEPVCKALDEHTEEGDPIFIWGFDSDLYITCRRRSASKYLYSTMVSGVVVPFWRDRRTEWVAENAQETLIAELTEQNVAVILDSPDRARGSSMLEVERLRDFVKARYERAGKLVANDGRKITSWVRRDLAD